MNCNEILQLVNKIFSNYTKQIHKANGKLMKNLNYLLFSTVLHSNISGKYYQDFRKGASEELPMTRQM